MKRPFSIKEKFHNISLIKRLIILYLVGPIFIFTISQVTSYYIIRSILDNKMQVSIQSDLNQTVEDFDKVISNLCGVAEQLALGEAGQNLSDIINEVSPYNKSTMINNLKNEINVISFTNSDLRLFGYYNNETKSFYYTNDILTSDYDILCQPCLAQDNKFTFYGPHKSLLKYNDDLVISVIREVPYLENKVYVYAECNVQFKTINLFLKESKFSIINSNNLIVYNSFDEADLTQDDFTTILQNTDGDLYNYYWKKVNCSIGYDMIIFTPKSEYNYQIKNFIRQSVLVMLLFVLLFSITVLFLLNLVVKPLNKFKKEIKLIQLGILTMDIYKTNIPEYDMILDEFMVMKSKIQDLLIEAEQSQKLQAKMQVEQLMYQINPHFLMNTLNTIHWLAVSKNDQDIDTVVMALNKLLFYNLKMNNDNSCVVDEINAIQQYITLQQKRFSFEYELQVLDQSALEIKIPHFILQPLVENAIYHGVGENGKITIKVDKKKNLELYVIDNGEGMTQEIMDKLFAKSMSANSGNEMGIGLNYVIKILKNSYGDAAIFRINSQLHKGTIIHITIPIIENRGESL